jgi:hypothetical protein
VHGHAEASEEEHGRWGLRLHLHRKERFPSGAKGAPAATGLLAVVSCVAIVGGAPAAGAPASLNAATERSGKRQRGHWCAGSPLRGRKHRKKGGKALARCRGVPSSSTARWPPGFDLVTSQDFIKFWGIFFLLEMIGISQGFKTF